MALMNNKNKVPTLQCLASQVFFDELVYKATHETVQSVRDLIDQHLWGKVKKTVREEFVAKFNEIFQFKFSHLYKDCWGIAEHMTEKYRNYSNGDGEKDISREYAPLDCMLDEYFTKLSFSSPTPTLDSFLKLMSIISQRAPKLKELIIWFEHYPYKLVNIQSPGKPTSSIPAMPSCQSLRFECLTYLGLSQYFDPDPVVQKHKDPLNDDPTHKSILSFIGKHCPALITLNASFNFCLKKKHLLGLILDGDVNENMFAADDERWSQDSVLEGLQVPTALLNPLCSTLQELSLNFNCYLDYNCDCTPEVYAFTLRHLPKLRFMPSNCDEIGIETLEIIHKVKEMGMSPHQKEFEESCREVAVAFNIGSGKDSITSPTPFTDFPLMERLNFPFPLSDADSVRAICSLFPHLKKASFEEELDTSFESEEETKFYTEELVPLLSGCLSEIDTLILQEVDPKFVKLILDAFGPNLTTLRFEFCKEIDFSLLASCSKLEELSIDDSSGGSTIKSEISDAASDWTPETYLPSLITFKCSACLGLWSPLIIERQSTKLTRLTLECCHIGTQAHNPRMEWTRIPELWPNMERWFIWQCTGLTMTTVSKLIPQLKKLREIKVPHSVLAQNPQLTEKMKQEFSNRKEPVEIIDRQTPGYEPLYLCPFQQP